MSRTPESLERAVEYARRIIESYQMDIRSADWAGVDLIGVGFCRGTIYRDALGTIDRIAQGELVV